MAPPPNNAWAQVNLRFTGAGVPTGAEVTFGVTKATDDLQDVATTVFNAWNTNVKSITPTAVTLVDMLIKSGPPDTGPQGSFAVGNAGTGASGDVSPGVCLLVQKRTALGGRKNRGRLYYPIAEADVGQGGAVASGALTAAGTAWNNFWDDLEVGSNQMAVFHSDLSTPTLVVSLQVSGLTATQRRRLRR
jgi:hypothetical protein